MITDNEKFTRSEKLPLITQKSPHVRGDDPTTIHKIFTVSDMEANDLIQTEINCGTM